MSQWLPKCQGQSTITLFIFSQNVGLSYTNLIGNFGNDFMYFIEYHFFIMYVFLFGIIFRFEKNPQKLPFFFKIILLCYLHLHEL